MIDWIRDTLTNKWIICKRSRFERLKPLLIVFDVQPSSLPKQYSITLPLDNVDGFCSSPH